MSVPRKNNRAGQFAIPVVAGPLGRCVEDLSLVLRAWWVPRMWEKDPYVTPKPFDLQTYRKGRGGGR